MRTDMDVLVLENFILFKEEQTVGEQDESWKREFVLD
jgi:carbamoyltransferase